MAAVGGAHAAAMEAGGDPQINPGGLPMELWTLIYAHTSPEDLQRAPDVCRQFRLLSTADIQFRQLLQAPGLSFHPPQSHPQLRKVSSGADLVPIEGDSSRFLEVGSSLRLHSSKSVLNLWSGCTLGKHVKGLKVEGLIRVVGYKWEFLSGGKPCTLNELVGRAEGIRHSFMEVAIDPQEERVDPPIQYRAWDGPDRDPGHLSPAIDAVGDLAVAAYGWEQKICVYRRTDPSTPLHSIDSGQSPIHLFGATPEPFGLAYYRDGDGIKVWRSSTSESQAISARVQYERRPSTGPDCWVFGSSNPGHVCIEWAGDSKWLTDEEVAECSWVVPLMKQGSFVALANHSLRGYGAGKRLWEIPAFRYMSEEIIPVYGEKGIFLTFMGQNGCTLLDTENGEHTELLQGDRLPILDSSGLALVARNTFGSGVTNPMDIYRVRIA